MKVNAGELLKKKHFSRWFHVQGNLRKIGKSLKNIKKWLISQDLSHFSCTMRSGHATLDVGKNKTA